MLKLEELRSGGDLWFTINIQKGLCIPHNKGIERLRFQQTGNTKYKYAQSEWITHLNATEFNKIELIELPKIIFPKIPLTEEIIKFVNKSNQEYLEGKYGSVLKENRSVIETLDRGLKEWFDKNSKSELEGKLNKDDRRKQYLFYLFNDKDKADRINGIIHSLHHYLSLDPHAGEHPNTEFTNYDAKFVMNATISLASDILNHIENYK